MIAAESGHQDKGDIQAGQAECTPQRPCEEEKEAAAATRALEGRVERYLEGLWSAVRQIKTLKFA